MIENFGQKFWCKNGTARVSYFGSLNWVCYFLTCRTRKQKEIIKSKLFLNDLFLPLAAQVFFFPPLVLVFLLFDAEFQCADCRGYIYILEGHRKGPKGIVGKRVLWKSCPRQHMDSRSSRCRQLLNHEADWSNLRLHKQ